MDLIPTPELIDKCGDRLLLALLCTQDWKTHDEPKPGDLCIETTKFRLDWERVGYLIAVEGNGEIYRIWTIAEREVTWRNANFRRIGRPGLRLPGFAFPGDPPT